MRKVEIADWKMILGRMVDFVKIETHGLFIAALSSRRSRCDVMVGEWEIRVRGRSDDSDVGSIFGGSVGAHARRREQLAVQLVSAPNGGAPTRAYRRGSMDERPWMAHVDPSARRLR